MTTTAYAVSIDSNGHYVKREPHYFGPFPTRDDARKVYESVSLADCLSYYGTTGDDYRAGWCVSLVVVETDDDFNETVDPLEVRAIVRA